MQCWRRLTQLLNGCWWKPGELPHYTSQHRDEAHRKKVVAEVTGLLLYLLYSRLMTVPTSNKLTQLPGSLDWLFNGLCPHNVMNEAYKMAFGKMTDVLLTKAAAHHERELGLTHLPQEVSWHKIQGSRMSDGRALFADQSMIVHTFILVITHEIMTWYMMWLVTTCRFTKDIRSAPPLLSMVNSEHSPLLVARQYLSSILAGSCPMVNLLVTRADCRTL